MKALGIALGVLNDSRGGQGYGVFTPHDKKTFKGTTSMASFIGKRGADWATAPRFFLHTRWPSKGDVRYAHSHPFTFGPVTGAHNGCVSNHDDLNKEFKRAFAVDSQHLIAHLAEGRSWKDVNAYGAVEWYDARDDKVRVVSFNNGDLEAVKIKDVGCVWSSDKTHLRAALECADLEGDAVPLALKEDMVYIVEGDGFYEDQEIEVGSYWGRSWGGGMYSSYRGTTSYSFTPSTTPTTPAAIPSAVTSLVPSTPTNTYTAGRSRSRQTYGFLRPVAGIARAYTVPYSERHNGCSYGHWDTKTVGNPVWVSYVDPPNQNEADYWEYLDEKFPDLDKTTARKVDPLFAGAAGFARVKPLSEETEKAPPKAAGPAEATVVDGKVDGGTAEREWWLEHSSETDALPATEYIGDSGVKDPDDLLYADDAPSGFLDEHQNMLTWAELSKIPALSSVYFEDDYEEVTAYEALEFRHREVQPADPAGADEGGPGPGDLTVDAAMKDYNAEMERIQTYRAAGMAKLLSENW